MLAGLGDALKPFAVTRKNFNAKLFFQLDDGFGNSGLRRVQGFGRFSQVELMACRFLNKSELMQVHGASDHRGFTHGRPRYQARWAMPSMGQSPRVSP